MNINTTLPMDLNRIHYKKTNLFQMKIGISIVKTNPI